jgi:hypothetical protein
MSDMGESLALADFRQILCSLQSAKQSLISTTLMFGCGSIVTIGERPLQRN